MTLPIFAGARRVGEVALAADGPHLTYDAAWLAAESFPISLTMPLSGQEWGPDVVTPWLMNLLPEGEPLRAMTQALGVAREDILGLIARTGGDLAGALAVGAPRAAPGADSVAIADAVQLERIIEQLPSKPFLVGEEGVSMSLAGAQQKLPLVLRDGALAIPVNGAASTHILKPDNPRLPGSVQNEALCMVLAARCGLSTAPVTTGWAGARSYLLVSRYDRVVADDGGVARIHQEDFCQALGRPPGAKYEHNQLGVRGPSLAEMFAVVREHMTARDLTRLLDAVIFNIAVGNVDSHAKNYSILLRPQGVELAPLYDLMSGLDWPNITLNHAQDVGGEPRGRHITGRHWRRLAAACGLAGLATVRRVARVTARMLVELPAASAEVAAMPAGPAALARFEAVIAERVRLVQANALRDEDPDPEPDAARDGVRYDRA